MYAEHGFVAAPDEETAPLPAVAPSVAFKLQIGGALTPAAAGP